LTAIGSSPVSPAHLPASAIDGGPSQRLALRRSAALFLATVVFIAVAVAAVCSTIGARFGLRCAAFAGLATVVILAYEAVRYFRRAPHAYKIGPDASMFWDRTGMLRAQGRIVECGQWSDLLLMLVLVEESGRRHRVLITADMLARDAFREIAVLARRSANL
jgi:hypothetical protein